MKIINIAMLGLSPVCSIGDTESARDKACSIHSLGNGASNMSMLVRTCTFANTSLSLSLNMISTSRTIKP